MQDNHAQWHIERTNNKKVDAISETNNKELTSKVDELIVVLKGKNEAQVNAISNAQIEKIDFIARNTFNPRWKGPNFGPNSLKPYDHARAPNNNYYNGAPVNSNYNEANSGNRQSLEDTLKSFVNSQTRQNSACHKMVENHDNILGQLTQKVSTMKNDL